MDPTLAAMFTADIAKSLAAQNTLLLLDHRALSGLLASNLLEASAQGYNTAARIPTTLSMGDGTGAVKGV